MDSIEELPKLLDELSFLSRETNGASFTIQHGKDNGQWKVVFTNAMMFSRDKLKYTTFDQAIKDAIAWIKKERKAITVPEEKYTLYNSQS